MSTEELIVAAILTLAIAALVVTQVHRIRIRTRHAAAREHLVAELVSRFSESREFVEFATSPAGKALLESEHSPAAVVNRVLSIIQLGVVAMSVGVALLINGVMPPPGADINLVRAAEDASWWGVVISAVAVGLLAAAALSAVLARRWGLIERRRG
jgi:hypothetical protein